MRKLTMMTTLMIMTTLVANAQQIQVNFDLNYATTDQVEAMSVKQGCMLPLDKKPMPQREGYRFGGWYTSKECQVADEWLFGSKSGGYFKPAIDSMAVEKPMTLYAKWVAPKHIKDAAGLNAMRDDLHGWYVLDNDIDLSTLEDWEPVGVYEADYEWADGEWWKNGFKGKLDGQGHSIRNLKLTKPTQEKKAMFGSLVNGEISNLVIEDCVVDMQTTSMYVAPLVGIMKQDGALVASITNVQVKHALFKVNLNNTKSAFSGVTGITVGAWNGTISQCSVQGVMDITMNGTGGGELYIGGIAGENYSQTVDCQTDIQVNVHFRQPQMDNEFKAFIGGMVASATHVSGCDAKGSISVDGDAKTKQLYIGGVVGSGRYGEISHNTSHVKVALKGLTHAQVGGIVGEYNKTYGGIGAALGTKLTTLHDCHASVEVDADASVQLVRGAISGSGQPDTLKAWGGQMDYRLYDCTWEGTIPDAIDKDVF